MHAAWGSRRLQLLSDGPPHVYAKYKYTLTFLGTKPSVQQTSSWGLSTISLVAAAFYLSGSVQSVTPFLETSVLRWKRPDTSVCAEESRRLPLISWVTDCRGGLSAAVASRTGCGGDTVSCERSLAPQAHPPRADSNLEVPNNEESCHTIERRASVLHAVI